MKKNLFYGMTFLLAASLTLGSCANKSNTKETTTAVSPDELAVLQVDDVLNNADQLVGQTITIEGICTHTCKHGGKKMFLMGSDESKSLRVDADAQIGSFPAEVVNNMVDVTGILMEERIDEAALQSMEEQYNAQQAEKHGDSEAGCATEKNAHGQKELDTFQQRMQDYRDRIAERKEKEGKEYLSFYSVDGKQYQVK